MRLQGGMGKFPSWPRSPWAAGASRVPCVDSPRGLRNTRRCQVLVLLPSSIAAGLRHHEMLHHQLPGASRGATNLWAAQLNDGAMLLAKETEIAFGQEEDVSHFISLQHRQPRGQCNVRFSLTHLDNGPIENCN